MGMVMVIVVVVVVVVASSSPRRRRLVVVASSSSSSSSSTAFPFRNVSNSFVQNAAIFTSPFKKSVTIVKKIYKQNGKGWVGLLSMPKQKLCLGCFFL